MSKIVDIKNLDYYHKNAVQALAEAAAQLGEAVSLGIDENVTSVEVGSPIMETDYSAWNGVPAHTAVDAEIIFKNKNGDVIDSVKLVFSNLTGLSADAAYNNEVITALNINGVAATAPSAAYPGRMGMVPAPPANSTPGSKVLKDDMTWGEVSGGSSGVIPVDPTTTPTANGSIWITTT